MNQVVNHFQKQSVSRNIVLRQFMKATKITNVNLVANDVVPPLSILRRKKKSHPPAYKNFYHEFSFCVGSFLLLRQTNCYSIMIVKAETKSVNLIVNHFIWDI